MPSEAKPLAARAALVLSAAISALRSPDRIMAVIPNVPPNGPNWHCHLFCNTIRAEPLENENFPRSPFHRRIVNTTSPEHLPRDHYG